MLPSFSGSCAPRLDAAQTGARCCRTKFRALESRVECAKRLPLEFAMQPAGGAARPLEQRRIEQKRAAIGECAEVAILPAPPRTPLLPSRHWATPRTGIKIQVAPEVGQFAPVPSELFGKLAVKLDAKMIGVPVVAADFSRPGTPGAPARDAAKFPRELALHFRGHRQQRFAADPLDQLAVARRVSHQRAPLMLLRISAHESRGQAAAAKRGEQARRRLLRRNPNLFLCAALAHVF
jgi:hypothetical protein